MAETDRVHLWAMRVVFCALCLLVMFFNLLPLHLAPRGFAGPDLIVALIFAWAHRRPSFVPPLAIAGTMLVADLVFQRPPGLMAAMVLIFAEQMKVRARSQRDAGFAVEWLQVSIALIVMALVFQIAMALLILPILGWATLLSQVVTTILVYPLVVAFSHGLLGIRHAGPRENDRMGFRS
ncbi:rod shape-determining protein MreD [Litorisediminicola beolgyonensis]|uniref:Rod shape-determining protein MreD n=1 Tax=Litorisediminicola beolgyonensis TaxID=1173614 RepID=A0ABW3ZMN7_9RHOB